MSKSQQRLTVVDRIEQSAMAAAQSLLTEFPELASVAVVVDWNLPGRAGDTLPSAVWFPASDVNQISAMAGMQTQLARAITMLMRAHYSSVVACAQERPSREDTPEHPDPDAGTPGNNASDDGQSSPSASQN